MIKGRINNYINNIEFLNNEINKIDKKISSQEAVKKQDVKILMSMTSIDYFSAMLIMSEIEKIYRFGNTNKLSHGRDYVQLCISLVTRYIWEYEGWKQKNTMDIDSSSSKNTAVRTDAIMKKYHTKIVKRHGHSIAITIVANMMIRIMWYM
jgi:transposase